MMTTVQTTSALDIHGLLQRSGGDLLRTLLELDRPEEFIRRLPPDDFYRMIRRIGEDDALPVLAAASCEQWQYVLDLESWNRDSLNTKKAMDWLGRLARADGRRLADWMFSEQGDLASFVLMRRAQILFREKEEEWDVPPGFFTLDGAFYIKAADPGEAPVLENFLRVLSREDYNAYRALLLDLSFHIPAETEEELYRLRSSRLAEYGFAPYEEALAVYAPLDPSSLRAESKPLMPGALVLPEEKHLIPSAAFSNLEDFGFLKEAVGLLADPPEANRVRLEFTTLCNTLIAADSFACVEDAEGLSRIGRLAAGYLHLALEALCSGDAEQAAKMLKEHSLTAIFRVGFGFARKLQWRLQHWQPHSWFAKRNRRRKDFWGSPWSEVMEGLLFARPLFFDPEAPVSYRPFERFDDVKKTEARLDQLEALDRMMARLTQVASEPAWIDSETFAPLLFVRWARHLLHLEPSFEPLTRAQAAAFFRLLRQGETGPPYRMERYRNIFIEEFRKGAAGFEPDVADALGRALSDIWDGFRSEYENVAAKDLSARYSKILPIADSGR
ncbi:MAG TPA: DUF6178 family protein [Smithellaceae bacterium]|nr:DUF6178 family protein [Smithellaceae bacterium]HRV45501.1 DUF6178 family protein [Smithellaceae bacterium]